MMNGHNSKLDELLDEKGFSNEKPPLHLNKESIN